MSKKELIIENALRLFSAKGFKETTVAELSKASSVAEGTIFHHFKNKEGLFLSILKEIKDGIIKEFDDYTKSKDYKNGMEAVENIISFYFYLSCKRGDWFMLLDRYYPYELAMVNDLCREYLEAIYNCFLDFFEQAIVIGQKDGSIAEMSARKSALIIFSIVHGLLWLKSHNLYESGTLYDELLTSCRKILQK